MPKNYNKTENFPYDSNKGHNKIFSLKNNRKINKKFLQSFEKEFYILTANKNMVFYNDTFIKYVWRHGRKERNICTNM